MRVLLLILIPFVLFAQSTFQFSPYFYGEDWQTKHSEMRAELQAWLASEFVDNSDLWMLESYTYTVSDSAIRIADMSQAEYPLLFRFVEPAKWEEADVKSDWLEYKKDGKLNVKGFTYKNFGDKARIKALKKADKDFAKHLYDGYKKIVAEKENDGKHWYKDNKKMNKKEKRSFAWRIVTGKSAETEITKK